MTKLRELTEQLLVSKIDEKINTNEELALVDDVKFTEHEEQYEKKKKYSYYKLAGYVVAGLIVAIIVQKVYAKLSKPKYNRSSLENIMKERLGAYNISETMADELLITAYDYNSQEPRFYSKYMAKLEPKIYDIPVGNATGASSAAPTFFDPKQQINGYGLKELQIDGGIICNNPALYAYQFAKIFNKKSKVRILSLGTGENPFKTLTSKYGWDKKSYGLYKSEFMMNMDNYAAEYYLKNQFAQEGRPKDFLRVQKYATKIPMDDISKSNLDLLEKTGSDLYDEEKVAIELFMKTILDEKYGAK